MRRRDAVRRTVRRGPALALVALALLPARALGQPASGADPSFHTFLRAFEAATRSFLDGDAAAWKELLSTELGGTLLTPFGGVVRDASALGEQYDRAAARFAPGPARLEVEYRGGTLEAAAPPHGPPGDPAGLTAAA